MPSALTVKKADNVTDIIYSPLAGATERSPAVWRQDIGQSAGLPSGMRPYLELGSTFNGPRTARRLPFKYVYPFAVLSADTATYSMKDMVLITGSVTLPGAIPPVIQSEGVHQCMNLLALLSIRQAISTGYAPV